MYEQFNTQFSQINKQMADVALKAHAIALEGFERALELQLKSVESQVNASVAFWTEASEARDFDAMKTLFPKSAQLIKESAEKAFGTSQELVGLSLKTSEALGELAKGQIEAANGQVKAAAKKAAK